MRDLALMRRRTSKPLVPGKHHIQHHQRVLRRKSPIDAALTVVNSLDVVAFRLEILPDQFAKSDVIVNYQHSFHRLFEIIERHVAVQGKSANPTTLVISGP
jgi:hypothetical protein